MVEGKKTEQGIQRDITVEGNKVRAAGNQKRRRVEGNKMSEQLGKQREIEWQGRRSQTSRAYK